MRLVPGYLLLALLIFLVEIYIAVAVHDRFIRPHGGDALVVVLIYCLMAGLVPWSRPRLAAGVVLFAFVIECLQGLRVLDRLGLGHHRLLRVVFGTDFDPYDLLAYAIAGVAIVAVEWAIERARARRLPVGRP